MGRWAEGPCPAWGSPGKKSSWQAALLAASILSSCFLLTQAQNILVTMKPSHPLKGQNVTLTPGGTFDLLICSWFREQQAESNRILTYIPSLKPVQNNGPVYTERETGGPGCSLHVRSLVLNDTGNYIVSRTLVNGSILTDSVHMEVLEKLSQPILWPAASTVKEHENVTLNCTTSESSSVSVSWLKDGNPIPVKSILSARNRTLTVPDISKDDEGMYTCEARNLANSATSNPSKITLENAGSQDNGLSAGQIVGIVIGCLLGAVIIVAVVYFVLKKTSFGMTAQHSSNGNIPSAPGRNQGVTDTKPTAGEEDIQYTTLAFNSNNPSPPGPGPTSPSESGTIYSVIKKK